MSQSFQIMWIALTRQLSFTMKFLKKVSIEQQVLSVFKKVNPSIFPIEKGEKEFNLYEKYMENIFTYRLNFPPKMFENAKLLEFGFGTGEKSLFFLRWGAKCTFVDNNNIACQRAEKLFQLFAPDKSKYKVVNKSIFNFKSSEKYDIVISSGVIHHTEDIERAFDVKSQYTKNGGFLLLGISNCAGFFQRNLQRAILYHLSESEEDIVTYANELFSEHLDRCEKFGRRSRNQAIYDLYVNPKYNLPFMSDVLNWFYKNKIRLYSSWPPVIPAIIGDPDNREPLEYVKFKNILSIPEIIWLTHTEDDINQLNNIEKIVADSIHLFKNMVNSMRDITPNTSIDFDRLKEMIDLLITKRLRIDLYKPHIKKLQQLLKETKQIIDCLQNNSIENLKKCIKNTKVLFRGTNGLGVNWFVGHKAK